MTAAETISPNSIVLIANDLQDATEETKWSLFGHEHGRDRVLSYMERELWNAEMRVKTESARDLSKEFTAKMAQKMFTNFKATDCFERWARDLKSQLIPYPLCGKRLELGELKNPRLKPDPTSPLF